MAGPRKPRENSVGCPPGEGTVETKSGGMIGNPPYVPTDMERRFVVEHACKKGRVWTAVQLGIDRATLYRHYKAEIEQSKANACAMIGSSLFEKALAGDGASQRFFLITQGNGEWSPKVKHEHSGPDGGPMRHVDLTSILEGKTDDEIRSIVAALELIASAGGGDIAGGYSGIDPAG